MRFRKDTEVNLFKDKESVYIIWRTNFVRVMRFYLLALSYSLQAALLKNSPLFEIIYILKASVYHIGSSLQMFSKGTHQNLFQS